MMTIETTELIEAAEALDNSILNAVLDGNRKWMTKNQKLAKAQKSLREAIDTLTRLAREEESQQEVANKEDDE